ncbi:ABC transporter ATP-binding protein [Hippea jasoniae]|uniref:ABC transporter ATP-binding protein n=1 Tax=Hippea jasoniae TaxID=944479 RepID=UPI000553FEC4|nr:ABC transporter ATP-binding protein [Hippea jasoniae]
MIKLDNVSKRYKKGSYFSKKYIDALKGASLFIEKGEHVGIVGESGAGKSTLCRILSLLELPSSGSIKIDGEYITKRNIKSKRGRVGIVFQDPATSINPLYKVIDAIKEATNDLERIFHICSLVSLKEELLHKYPSQLSGGELQRAAIVRALCMEKADYIVFDEFTSALDISTQVKIVSNLVEINRQRKYGFVFVSHDIRLVNFLSDRIYVIYKGEIVEELVGLKDAKHPYTKSLINGETTKRNDSGSGCSFYEFCPYAKEICRNKKPELLRKGNYAVRCFLYYD